MTETLEKGARLTCRITVDSARTIDFMGDDCRVYATPKLVNDIEHACRDLLLEYGSPGEDSVGTYIAISHMAPTLLGMEVEITVTVRDIEDRRVRFDVRAKDALETIGQGEHERFVVDTAKTVARLRAKSAKVAALKP